MVGSLFIRGHSAGSYAGMVWETILAEFPDIEGRTVLAAIALPPSLLTRPRLSHNRQVHLIHHADDRLCIWNPSLPSFVLGLVFCFLSCVAPLWLCFCCVGVSACAVVGVFPWSSCSLLWVVGPPFVCRLFGCCRLPSLPVVVSLPPAVGPLWRPGPVFTLVPPSGYLVAFCDGLVALPHCWGCCCALSSSLHFVSWQPRPLALCGVLFSLYTMMHVLLGCSVLPR